MKIYMRLRRLNKMKRIFYSPLLFFKHYKRLRKQTCLSDSLTIAFGFTLLSIK